jgi:hypothetical protein
MIVLLQNKNKGEMNKMRNSTKKITAIAAALLVSVSGVATTASMAAPAVLAASAVTPEEAAASAFEFSKDTAETIKVEATDSKINLYVKDGESYKAADSFAENQAYNFGKEIKPLDDSVTYYIRVYNDNYSSGTSNKVDDANEKNEYVAVKLSYTNNVNVDAEGKKAEITATIVDSSKTYDLGDTTVTTISGSQKVGEFTVTAFDLTGAEVKVDQVEYTWDGEGITVNQADFKLYTLAQDANGKDVKQYIDSSLYKVVSLSDGTNTINIDTKTNRATGEYVKPGEFKVTIAPADENNKNIVATESSGVIEKAVKINKAKWSDVKVTFGSQTTTTDANVTVTLNGHELTANTHYEVASAAVENTNDTVAKVTVTAKSDYFTAEDKTTGTVDIGADISKYITSVALKDTKTTSYTYTGEEIKPEVVVTPVNNVTLTEGVDYEIVYTDNVNAGGTPAITVKGLGTYAGEKTLESAFSITKAKLTDATVTAEDVTYETTLPTVEDLAKALVIKNGNTTLVYGEDFNVVAGTVKDGENTLRITAITGGNYTGMTTATVNVVKVVTPAAPTNVKTTTTTDSSIKVKFAAVENATGYEIYANGTKVATATTQDGAATITKTVTGLDADTEYTLTVKAVNTVGENTKTSEASEAVTASTRLAKVTGLKAIKKTKTTLKLQFNAVEGADGYKIYDAETGKAIASVSTQGGADVLKKTVTGLKAGQTRKYKVRAYKLVDGQKVYGAYSAVYTKATAK